MMGLLRLTKAQMFYTDFMASILIIATAISIYYGYVSNTISQDSGILNDIITDTTTISSSLLTGGVPNDWDVTTVQRIGLTNNEHIFQQDKLDSFQQIDYNKTKNLLSTRFNYIVFFERWNGTIIPIDNKCGIGMPEIVTDYLGICLKPNMTSITMKTLVTDTRLGLYENDIIRMIVYLWE